MGVMNDNDRRLRARQKAEEAARDEVWDAAHADAPHFEQLASWNLHEMERDFAERMISDGLDVDSLVGLVLSMRHAHDPLYVGVS